MISKFIDNNTLNVYRFGSVVYGLNTSLSDEDYIFVVNNGTKIENEIFEGNINISIYSLDDWKQMSIDHHIAFLECHFLNDEHIILEKTKVSFELDLIKLRRSISSVVSNSWVKCKKKLIKDSENYNVYTGLKSLFHSFRICMFGIDIAKNKKLTTYNHGALLFNDIMNMDDNWELIYKRYKKLHNKYLSEFRTLAPKK